MKSDELGTSTGRPAQGAWERSDALQRFLALNDDLMALVDAEGRFLCASPAAARVLGVRAEALAGRSIFDFVHPEDLRRTQEVFRACCRSGSDERCAFEHRLAEAASDAPRLAWTMAVRRAPDGALIDVAALARRSALVAGPSTDVEAREAAFARALQDIASSASTLLHDIKNPITGIQFAVKAVGERLGEDDRAILLDLQEHLERVERGMRRALGFAKPLRLRRRSISPRSLLEAAAERVRPALSARAVELTIDGRGDLPALEVDADLLEEALVELLGNAIEAVEPRGRIRLSVTRAQSSGLALLVEDDGPGVPEQRLRSLFEPFSTTKPARAGMGLALSKKIVEAHGGRIRVGRSSLGGASFEISLPAGVEDGDTGGLAKG